MVDGYSYSITVSDSVVRLKTSGQFEHLAALRMWAEVIAECEKNDCFKVLAVSHVEQPLPTSEVFNSSEFFASVGLDQKYRLAVVTENAAVHESHLIAASALKIHNKQAQFPAAAFKDEQDARQWLHLEE
jgi:hypothetical protein